jgi:hypothetical protein
MLCVTVRRDFTPRSMQRAVEGMYKERRHVFRQFATGLFTLLFAVIFGRGGTLHNVTLQWSKHQLMT